MFGTYSAFYEIKGKYHCFFKGFGPLLKVMEYEDEWCLVLFLLELETQEMLLKGNNTATEHQQRKISTFFSPITHATSQSRATQMGSGPGHNKGVTIDQTIAICRARRPPPHVPQSHNPCHQQIKALSPTIAGASRALEISPIWINLCQRSIEGIYNISDLRIIHVPRTRFFSLFLSYLIFYLVTFVSFDLLFSNTRHHLRCNHLFDLTGHFGILKDVNISSFYLKAMLTKPMQNVCPSLSKNCRQYNRTTAETMLIQESHRMN